ncbi:MAG: acyltransferase [candidate division Zixibacteria bacterium]|nr:acyltransferase [candidate division Zixibacteria bacterium]
MKVAFIQMQPEFGMVKNNIEKALSMIDAEPAELYVLPELFNSGYVFTSQDEVNNLAENVDDGFTRKTISAFSKNKKIAVIYGFPEKTAEGIYNSCAFIDSSGSFHLYRKLHLYFDEKKYFLPGNLPLEVFTYENAKIGMMICFDWIFPEVARCLALMNADIICHPANLVMPFCQEAMKTRSIENCVFTVTANRIGEEFRGNSGLKFTGKSQITDVKGNVLYRASDNKEESFSADIMIEKARRKNINDLNNLWQDRRVEYYKCLGEI